MSWYFTIRCFFEKKWSEIIVIGNKSTYSLGIYFGVNRFFSFVCFINCSIFKSPLTLIIAGAVEKSHSIAYDLETTWEFVNLLAILYF